MVTYAICTTQIETIHTHISHILNRILQRVVQRRKLYDDRDASYRRWRREIANARGVHCDKLSERLKRREGKEED